MTEKTTNVRPLICTEKREINWPALSGQGNNCIPYVTAVRDCNEARTCEEQERQRSEGMRGPEKEYQGEHLTSEDNLVPRFSRHQS